MPRLPYVGVLLVVAGLSSVQTSAQSSAQTSAQTAAKTPAQSSTRVQHVVVRGTDAAMEVEIQTSGSAVAPDTQAITGPDRIVVDFPGALPDAELRALKVNRGALKGVRSGLFFSNPPITRIVLDLLEPQSYQISTNQISTNQNTVVVKLSPVRPGSAKQDPVTAAAANTAYVSSAPAAKLQNVSLASGTLFAGTTVAGTIVAAPRVAAVSSTSSQPAVSAALPPLAPLVTVTLTNGMLRIRTEKATLAQVLFEVQRQTQAEIAIPAGAEQEEVAVDLGPAPARDVLGTLLNGSPYNFIFVGDELSLERVILTRRDASSF
jgi:hypothetical protein